MKGPLSQPNRRVLVVDDSTAIHEDFRKVLKRPTEEVDEFELQEFKLHVFGKAQAPSGNTNFEVEFASQGQQGWEMVQRAVAEKRPYAMAFMDVRMPPGWDGVETTAKIWEVDPDLQIVICSVYSDYSWDDMAAKL